MLSVSYLQVSREIPGNLLLQFKKCILPSRMLFSYSLFFPSGILCLKHNIYEDHTLRQCQAFCYIFLLWHFKNWL